MESEGKAQVRIWSFEHDAWWAPNYCGYVRDIEKAGFYERKAAERIVENANRFSDKPMEELREIES